jgi:radical SAM protein with 4Fe4S-binding SPASM domain
LGDEQIKTNMDISTIESILIQASKMDTKEIIISGGEPLLHPDFHIISKKVTDSSFTSYLETNGSMISPENIKDVAQFDGIQISIDANYCGLDSGLRDGNLDEIREQLRMLLEYNPNVHFFMTIGKSNYLRLQEVIDSVKDLGIEVGVNIICPVGGATGLQEEFLTKKTMNEVLPELCRMYEQGEISKPTDPLTILYMDEKRNSISESTGRIVGGCISGVAGCFISANGDVMPCAFIRISAGNLFNKSLNEIWVHSPLFKQLRDRNSLSGKCSVCEYKWGCGGCRARSYYLTNDLMAEDPWCPMDGKMNE